MKLISISVYGKKPMYVHGALLNIPLMKRYYPGWTLRVYHSMEAPVKALREAGGIQLINMGRSLEHSGMFWRFLPAWEEDVERVIFRDSDSRLNPREAAAVKEWEDSGKVAHCMHDHPHHACLPLFGGMWGIIPGHLDRESLHRLRKAFQYPQARGADMTWLTRWILPQIQTSLMRHSSQKVRWPGALPFPPHEEYKGFVGQQHDDNGKPINPKT